MAATGAESKSGTKSTTRRPEVERNEDGEGFSDADSMDHELSMLMPELTKRLKDDDDGTLNFMGSLNMSDANNFAHNDKENAGSTRNSFGQFKRKRRQVTNSKPIDLDKLSTKNKTVVSTPSGSLYKNITTVLKENVNKTGVHSLIVDDFWETERQRKIAAVARRRLTGGKTPEQTKLQPIEDRRTRHARSRRGGGNSRKLGKRHVELDLGLDAIKISEWDQEILAVEEEIPFISAGRPVLEGESSAALERGRLNVSVPVGANGEADRKDKYQEETCVGEEYDPEHHREAPHKANSRSSLSDMDLSVGESPIADEQDVSRRVQHGQYLVQDRGGRSPDLIMKKTASKGDDDKVLPGDSIGLEAIEQSLSRSPRTSRSSGHIHGGQPHENVNQGSQLMDGNLAEDRRVTPREAFPVPERSLQIPGSPVTSSTPPSNPVAAYLSLMRLEGDVGQRRLAFLSSCSSEAGDTDGWRKAEKLDMGEVNSRRDLWTTEADMKSASKEDFDDAKFSSGEVQSRYDLCDSGTHQMTAARAPAEAKELQHSDKISPTAPSDAENPQEIDEVKESLFVASCDRVTPNIDNTATTQKVKEAIRDESDSSKRHHHRPLQRDNNNLGQDLLLFNNKAGDPNQGGNGLLAISQDYGDSDNDLEVPDIDEAARDGKPIGAGQAEQLMPPRSPQNVEGYNDLDVPAMDKAGHHGKRIGAGLAEQPLPPRSPQNVEGDNDLEVPDIDEAGHHGKSTGAGQVEQPMPCRSPQNVEELDNEVGTADAQGGDIEALLRSADAPQNIAPDEGLVWKDEGSTTKKTKPKRVRRKLVKAKERRFSLEEGGSTWKDGQRRSQRRRVRPLEWWRGEKLLYGRVHKSLTTIIGIKHSSPGKYARGIDTPFTVESFVPAKYNDLVRYMAS